MSRADKIEMEGVVIDTLKGLKFKVKLDGNNKEITCTMGGRLKINNIRVLNGDKVTVEISPYDLERGIITWRHK